jgi:hypothetical protein
MKDQSYMGGWYQRLCVELFPPLRSGMTGAEASGIGGGGGRGRETADRTSSRWIIVPSLLPPSFDKASTRSCTVGGGGTSAAAGTGTEAVVGGCVTREDGRGRIIAGYRSRDGRSWRCVGGATLLCRKPTVAAARSQGAAGGAGRGGGGVRPAGCTPRRRCHLPKEIIQ